MRITEVQDYCLCVSEQGSFIQTSPELTNPVIGMNFGRKLLTQ